MEILEIGLSQWLGLGVGIGIAALACSTRKGKSHLFLCIIPGALAYPAFIQFTTGRVAFIYETAIGGALIGLLGIPAAILIDKFAREGTLDHRAGQNFLSNLFKNKDETRLDLEEILDNKIRGPLFFYSLFFFCCLLGALIGMFSGIVWPLIFRNSTEPLTQLPPESLALLPNHVIPGLLVTLLGFIAVFTIFINILVYFGAYLYGGCIVLFMFYPLLVCSAIAFIGYAVSGFQLGEHPKAEAIQFIGKSIALLVAGINTFLFCSFLWKFIIKK